MGAGAVHVDVHAKTMSVGGRSFREGDILTLNGTRGLAYAGALKMMDATENPRFQKFMNIADELRTLKVRTNADTPEDAAKAREFGAEGIGLFRTEHMFYGKNSEQPLFILRKMILSDTEEKRRAALDELFPFVKRDIKNTLAVMNGLPVTIRLLDPPLHEFVPNREDEREKLASSLGISMERLTKRAEDLHESNPMMGHRGVRLGVTFPEISEMQYRAILESAAELIKEGKKVMPEIMIPVVGHVNELENQKKILDKIHAEVCRKMGVAKVEHMFGTMIEVPRAAITADRIASVAQFFSFGTNDLTQMTFAFSRDDIGAFVPDYVGKKILPIDPFQVLDRDGVGTLMKMAVEKGRSTRKDIKLGICGEHGGEPSSVEFCHQIGLSYVSCSPFRVPIARLAAAQAAIQFSGKKPEAKKLAKKAAKKPVKAASKPKAKAGKKAAPKKKK